MISRTSAIVILSAAALALTPAVPFVSGSDAGAAHAKSDKGGGGGNGNGGGNGGGNGNGNGGGNGNGNGGGNGKERASGNGGGSRGGTASARSGSGGSTTRTAPTRTKKKSAAPSASAVQVSLRPSAKPAKAGKHDLGGFHPSELGNMNGALHASPNAIEAHMRNGNYNGPVGLMAGLVVAKTGAEGAQGVIDQVAEFDALDQALADGQYATIDDYYAALDGVPGIDPIQSVEDAIAGGDDAALADALAAAGYDSIEDYQGAVAGTAGVEPDAAIDDAIADLGGDSATRTGITDVEPTEEELAGAESALDALGDAETAILDFWNKNEDADPEIVSDEEQGLLDLVYTSLEGYGLVTPEEPAEESVTD